MLDIPVLISGGGPVGLAASLLLSQHGVRSLLVERHPATALTPKARGINARTMEVFRQCGIDAAVRQAGLAEGGTGLIVWTETLAGKEIERRVPGRATAKNMAATPVKNCLCAQDDLEPVIRRFAESAGPGTLRFNTELTSFSQKPGGVTGVLTDRMTGEETPFTARYLIAAEGAQSRVRRALGVKMIGEEKVYDSVNILFEADLTQWVTHRPAALYFVEQEDLRATFLTINGRDRWGFLIHGPRQYGWEPQDFTPELCGELIRKAVGMPIESRCSASVRGKRPPSFPTAIASATSSWPATPPTRCRRPGALASTPACRTFTTSSGRSPRSCAATPTPCCSTATTTSASRWARSSPGIRSPTRCRWDARRGKAMCCRGANSSTSRG